MCVFECLSFDHTLVICLFALRVCVCYQIILAASIVFYVRVQCNVYYNHDRHHHQRGTKKREIMRKHKLHAVEYLIGTIKMSLGVHELLLN